MADEKLSALTELAAEPASNDELYIRDESEVAATESKRITVANLLSVAPPDFNDGTSDPLIDGDSAADGTEDSPARKDHVHPKHHTKYTDSDARTAAVSDTVYGAGWNGVTTIAPSKNAVYDKIETLSAGPTFVHKTADETLNNNNTLQNDDDLVFAVGANEIWVYQMMLIVNADPNADFKWAITVPGSSTIDKGGHHGFGGYNFSAAVAAGAEKGVSISCGQTGVDAVVTLMGIIDTAGTSGNVQLQWAQYTAHASDIKVKIGSYLMAWKVA